MEFLLEQRRKISVKNFLSQFSAGVWITVKVMSLYTWIFNAAKWNILKIIAFHGKYFAKLGFWVFVKVFFFAAENEALKCNKTCHCWLFCHFNNSFRWKLWNRCSCKVFYWGCYLLRLCYTSPTFISFKPKAYY